MSIGSRIREARQKQEYTQEQLAALLGVTKGAIANYENGISVPKTEILLKLIDALRCDANYLYQDDIQTMSAFLVAFPERTLLKKYRALDDHGRDLVDCILDKEYTRIVRNGADVKLHSALAPRIRSMQVYTDPSAAGVPLYAESDYEYIDFPEDEIPANADFGVRISGDSMEPTIHDGDIAWIRATAEIDDGRIGVFMLDGGDAVCKRVELKADGRVCALRSDNAKYPPIKGAYLNGLRVVGEVLVD